MVTLQCNVDAAVYEKQIEALDDTIVAKVQMAGIGFRVQRLDGVGKCRSLPYSDIISTVLCPLDSLPHTPSTLGQEQSQIYSQV